MRVATNIVWFIDRDEILEKCEDMKFTKALFETKPNFTEEFWKIFLKSSVEDREHYILDEVRHNRVDYEKLVGLPREVEVNVEWDDEMVTEYLQQEYGYYVDSYKLADIPKHKEKLLDVR